MRLVSGAAPLRLVWESQVAGFVVYGWDDCSYKTLWQHRNYRRIPMKILPNNLLVGLMIFTCAINTALAGEDEAVKKDTVALQGKWSMVSGERDGQPLPPSMLSSSKRVAEGDQVTVTIDGELFLKARFTIDPSKRPATIDYAVTEGIHKGKTQLGIYELDGDTVKFCFCTPGKPRPSDFTTKPESGRTASVWKKDSKK